MADAGRPATCPRDGAPAERVFTPPMTGRSPAAQKGGAAPASGAPAARRDWSSPFFPRVAPGERPASPPPPRHQLPPGSSRPTRFRHFGHWHSAGTPPHTHRPRRSLPSPPTDPAPS